MKKIDRRQFLAVSGALCAAAALSACGAAASTAASSAAASAAASPTAASAGSASAASQAAYTAWPTTKNVEMVVPASAGGGTDMLCRLLTTWLTTNLPQSNWVVNNLTDGNGTVGFEKVRNGAKDGSELLYFHTGMLIKQIIGAYSGDLLNDFDVVNIFYNSDDVGQVLCVRASSDWKTIDDFVTYCKANAGKVIAGIENGSAGQFQTAEFMQSAGIELRVVDAGSASERVSSLLGSHIDCTFLPGNSALQYEQSGDFRLLGMACETQSKSYPTIPAMGDLGYHDIDVPTITFIAAPKGTDSAILGDIDHMIEQYMNDDAAMADFIKANQLSENYYEYVERDWAIQYLTDFYTKLQSAGKLLGY